MLKALNPLSKLCVCCVWLVASVLVFDPRFQLAAIFVPALTLVIFNRTSPLVLLALMVPFALFGFGFLSTSLLFRRESDFALRMAGEALRASPAFSAGITLFLRALACGMISVFFALTTDPGLFVRALMRHTGLPPRIGYSLFAAMQLVPDLAGEAQQMRLARAMRSGRRLRRIPGPFELMSLVIPLLAFAIRRAGRTAIAMEARGLGPEAPRTIMNAPDFDSRDGIFVTVGFLVLGLCTAAVVMSQ
ncbi:energy-coupling factor transporter transmembrane component T family protein [Microvirga sp. Mcv34]|uniref:energy-coupling factor transporter transmembrane component T family protein n=1 Tax=Microvirga sp. Mcv34 TaxID=2926016 RepID=UPI0021C7F723|nr:energy-coupling factor transporter transmembrane component T [Microvirga sp. Mcv34]